MDTLLIFLSLSSADQKRIREIHKRLIRMGVNSNDVIAAIIESRSAIARFRADHQRTVRAEAVRADWK